ncbi:response regulator transcription factor [Virgibacillus sp. C22-A2]|uniref:Response regulator transcription factor n=1 Tax=Virgibacillus tibetensis TaxID=3042313 RepID=A0ABU6KH80_9BACI|nr:response regulator transcription factor [Virgibacillus sp. C22-A2]
MKEVLIINQKKSMFDLLVTYLKPHHYQCHKEKRACEALFSLKEHRYDIVLMDISTGDRKEFEFCNEIKRISNVPVILIAACEQRDAIIGGLQSGADDYITLPLSATDLLVRMQVVLCKSNQKPIIEANGLKWNEACYKLTYNNKPIKLTPKEFSIIGHLMRHKNQVFAREQLIELIWGFNSHTEGRTIDSHVRNMREKIRHEGYPIDEHFKTVWGVGYQWVS